MQKAEEREEIGQGGVCYTWINLEGLDGRCCILWEKEMKER